MSQFRPSRFQLLPDVVKNLLIINGLFFLATIVLGSRFGIDLTDLLGLHFPGSEKFKPYQLISYMFMHGSFAHIFFNMLAVWMFGSAIENVWGPKKFLVYYIITGLGAAVIHYSIVAWQITPMLDAIDAYITNPDHDTWMGFVTQFNQLPQYQNLSEALPLPVEEVYRFREEFLNLPNVVGASGALFGILLAFGMMFPNSIIYLYFAIPIKAKYFVILYGAIELYMGLSNNPNDNVAHFAHLGGMLFGFFLIKLWNKNRYYY